jgi:hypothetical protein
MPTVNHRFSNPSPEISLDWYLKCSLDYGRITDWRVEMKHDEQAEHDDSCDGRCAVYGLTQDTLDKIASLLIPAVDRVYERVIDEARAEGTPKSLYIASLVEGNHLMGQAREALNVMGDRAGEDPALVAVGEIRDIESLLLKAAAAYGEAARLKGTL